MAKKKIEATNYHHGNLPIKLIEAAVSVLSQVGITKLSLREVARRAGVSHGAPAHHFGDKQGLFTAIAAAGFRLQTEKMQEARRNVGRDSQAQLSAIGRAYILFAAEQPEYFGVMFQRDIINEDDSSYLEALEASATVLKETISGLGSIDVKDSGQVDAKFIASWGMVHGIATLLLSGNLKEVSDANDLNNLLDSIFDQPN